MKSIKAFLIVILLVGTAFPVFGQSSPYQRLATIPDVTSFDWSTSENRMVVLQNAEAICIWDAQTQFCNPIRSYSEIVGEVELSPDGRLLAVRSADSGIHIIDLESQDDIPFEGTQAGESYYSIDWSHNGQYLAVGASGVIHIFETETWTEEKTFVLPERALTTNNLAILELSWSPNDRYIASNYPDEGGIAGVLDIIEVETGIRVHHNYTLSRGAGWQKGGQLFVYIAGTDRGHAIRFLDGTTFEIIRDDSIQGAAYVSLSPDGEYLMYAVPDNAKFITLDMDTGVVIAEIIVTSRTHAITWSYDGRYLAVKDSDQQLSIYSSTLPMTTIKGLLWDDANGDGIRQPEEPPLSNLVLTALDSVATATTDSNGTYHFVVVPGTYTLEINTENYLLSPQNQGTDETLDSDFDPLTHRTMPITIMGKETIDRVNAGLHLPLPPSATPDPCTSYPATVPDLISAITTANMSSGLDTLCLSSATTYTFTTAYIPLNALPAITSDITICSTEGATLTRQAGSALFGFFEVNAGGSLTLENLTLNGGDVGNDTGGALVNEGGTVTLNNVTFTNNHANTGGAIDNESGSLTITGSTFQNNQATFGGAIDNDAGNMLSITGSTFTSNTAQNDGGAIHNDGGTLTVTDSTFTSNTANRYGGALDNLGQATLSSSTLSGNSAAWSGGAIRNTNILTVNNGSVLENNAATVGGNSEGWGGGVYNASGGTATLSSVTLSENDAIQGGGIRNHGSLTLNENTQLTGNSASNRGGGIYNAGGTLTLTNSVLLNNAATGDGGAIYVTSTGSQVTITGSTVSGNSSGASGGAIRSSQGMTITDSVFSNNTATSNYGSLYLTSSSTTTAHHSCFSGNSATSVGFTGTAMQDFTGNWWGAANGPSGAGSGSGDAVNNRINFANFLTAGCPHP